MNCMSGMYTYSNVLHQFFGLIFIAKFESVGDDQSSDITEK